MFTSLACCEDLRDNVSQKLSLWLAHRKCSVSGRQWYCLHAKWWKLGNPLPFLCSIFLSSTAFFFFSGKKSHFQSLSSCPLSFLHQSAAPYHLSPPSCQIAPPLPHWTFSVILPVLFPLTWGMTKTVSHLFRAHLYSLYKCIRPPCFMKQNALNRSFSWWLRVMSMNTNDYSVLYSYRNHWRI